MSEIISDGNMDATLVATDYKPDGELKTLAAELALCVGSAKAAEQFITNKQWALLWRDADLLYQAPRPMTVYENTYVLEPNVQRFTVAKTVNSIVPQLYKGLFYQDPPMLLRPRPGTSQDVTEVRIQDRNQVGPRTDGSPGHRHLEVGYRLQGDHHREAHRFRGSSVVSNGGRHIDQRKDSYAQRAKDCRDHAHRASSILRVSCD
jgi:hypothetical protein